MTYVAGPFADEPTTGVIRDWLADGGRWLGLHGSAGGKAVRVEGRGARRMVKAPYHEALGAFFLTHPPVRDFEVTVADRGHVLTDKLPPSFAIRDEPYWIEVQHPETRVLLTMDMQEAPAGHYAMVYDEDTTLLPDGRSRALGIVRDVGEGGVAYFAPGHCQTPVTGAAAGVADDQPAFRGPWETAAYRQLLSNAWPGAPASRADRGARVAGCLGPGGRGRDQRAIGGIDLQAQAFQRVGAQQSAGVVLAEDHQGGMLLAR